jgi:hypothetical protein
MVAVPNERRALADRLAAVAQFVFIEALVFIRFAQQREHGDQDLSREENDPDIHAMVFARIWPTQSISNFLYSKGFLVDIYRRVPE